MSGFVRALVVSVASLSISPSLLAQDPVPVDLTAILTNAECAGGAFGYPVAASENRVALGIQGDIEVDEGRVMIFAWNDASAAWLVEASVTCSNPCDAEDTFAAAVALTDDVLAVGTPGAEENVGVVYVFRRNEVTGLWTEEAVLAPLDGMVPKRFGSSLAIEGNTLIVGAPFDDGTADFLAGSVYTFEFAGGMWVQTQKIESPVLGGPSTFGSSLALSEDRMVIGAPQADDIAGRAVVFSRTAGFWSQASELVAPEGLPGDGFGWSVDLDASGRVLVGAPFSRAWGWQGGEAHLFQLDAMGGANYEILFAPEGGLEGLFGKSVALGTDFALIGAPANTLVSTAPGSVFLFRNTGFSDWTSEEELRFEYAIAPSALGQQIVVTGDLAVMGIAELDPFGAPFGCALLHDCN